MRHVFLLMPLAALLALACSGGGGQTQPTLTPSPTPEPTPTPTVKAEAGGQDGFRTFADEIEAALADRDVSFFVDRAVIIDFVCEGPGINCEKAGQRVVGVEVFHAPGDGWIATVDSLQASIADFFDGGRPDLSDEYGHGGLRLHSIFVRPVHINDELGQEEYWAVATQISTLPGNAETTRKLLLLVFGLHDGRWLIERVGTSVVFESGRNRFLERQPEDLMWEARSTPAPPCAAGSTQRFRDVVAEAPWAVYCPAFLPDGYELEDIVYGLDLLGADRRRGGAMQARFVNTETGGHVTFIQGLPGLSALTSGIRGQEVLENIPYGDQEAKLFRSSPDYPGAPFLAVKASFGHLLYFMATSGEITHWIEASGLTEDETREIAAEMRPATTLYWTTYRNDEYGFEYQYPKSCEIREGSLAPGSRIEFNIFDSEGLSLAEHAERFIDELERQGELYEIESTRGSVGGRESITISYRFEGIRRFATATLVERDASIYRFGVGAGGYTCDIEPAVYSRMLSTFRFIE